MTILTLSSETAPIMFTPIGKLFECELSFRGAQASLHPSRSSAASSVLGHCIRRLRVQFLGRA